jgi:hypothetical protein
MFVLLIALLIMQLITLLGGCTTLPRYRGVAVGGNEENVLGVTVDENLQVLAIAAGSAAQHAGVEIGDVLVSLTWVLSEAPEALPATEDDAAVAATTASFTSTGTVLRPPPGVENKTIPFTDGDGIRMLASYGVPLRLQFIRRGQALASTIIPAPLAAQSDLPATTSPSSAVY